MAVVGDSSLVVRGAQPRNRSRLTTDHCTTSGTTQQPTMLVLVEDHCDGFGLVLSSGSDGLQALAQGDRPMSDRSDTGNEALSPSQLEGMDQVCDRFEEAWKTGRRPQIEDYWKAVPEAERSVLLRE